ncbi:MAG: phosphoenolpyruvate kinase, partial [Myxococcaceae bacterium]|nr:phosphoenolpyruvate kinase [Myxococcaceae bacterium]
MSRAISVVDEAQAELDELGAANRAFMQTYPGDRPARQPVHTVYGGAQLYKAETTRRLGELALHAMSDYGRDPFEFALGVGFVSADALARVSLSEAQAAFARDPAALRREHASAWSALTVYERVREKLVREPVEDFRIDFEDGFGARPDAEEDATAIAAAHEVARGLREHTLPPFLGIRIKSFGEEWKLRGARTLELFLDTLLSDSHGVLPDNFVVTLPKVTVAEQPRTLIKLL